MGGGDLKRNEGGRAGGARLGGGGAGGGLGLGSVRLVNCRSRWMPLDFPVGGKRKRVFNNARGGKKKYFYKGERDGDRRRKGRVERLRVAPPTDLKSVTHTGEFHSCRTFPDAPSTLIYPPAPHPLCRLMGPTRRYLA